MKQIQVVKKVTFRKTSVTKVNRFINHKSPCLHAPTASDLLRNTTYLGNVEITVEKWLHFLSIFQFSDIANYLTVFNAD